MDLPKIIGHRGVASLAPENTVAGFEKAAALGLTWIECDVALLGDGTPILFHDDTLDRTSNGEGALAGKRLADIAAIDAGSWFDPAFAGEPIPTLGHALDALRTLGLGVNLELKTHGRDPGRLAQVVANHLAGRDKLPELFISSFDHAALRHFRRHDPKTPVAVLYGEVADDWPDTVAELGAFGVVAGHWKLTPKDVGAVKAEDLYAATYTVNEPGRADTLLGWGVDSIITDRPQDFDGFKPL